MSQQGTEAAPSKEEDGHDRSQDVATDAKLDRILQEMRGNDGVEVKDRTWLMKMYPNVFVGKDAANWMVERGFAKSVAEAVDLGRRLQERGDFAHVTGDHEFKAEKLFYRFADDQIYDHGHQAEEVQTWAQFLPGNQTADSESDGFLPSQPAVRADDASVAGDPGLQHLLELNLSPLDEFNIKLLDQVAPPQWANPHPKDESRYNLVAIGAGAGGLVCSAGSASLGAKVALVERHMLGGDCLNFGCVPSKALIRCAAAVVDVKNARRFGVLVGDAVSNVGASGSRSSSSDSDTNCVTVDFGAVMARMRRLRSEIAANDSAERLAKLGVDVFIGKARFSSKSSIEVTGVDGTVQTLQFAKCVIGAGSRPAVPPIEGLSTLPYLTNYTVFNLTELPRRFGIIGSGPVGSELAQAFAVSALKSLFWRAREMETDGVHFMFKCKFVACSLDSDGRRVVEVEHMDEKKKLVFDELLVSTGRKPNIEDLDLETAGVDTSRNGVEVNDFLQTTNSNVFAVGDICTPFKFTHMSDAMARLAIRNALFFGSSRMSRLTVPWCTFTSPEVAHVGLYDHDLDERGIKYDTFEKEFTTNDRARIDDEPEGCFVRVHVSAGSDKILGATIVNDHAGDMIHELSVCMAAGFGLSKLGDVIHPYPTQGETIRGLGNDYKFSKLTPAVKVIFRKFLAVRR